jgi:four helix bundle protein
MYNREKRHQPIEEMEVFRLYEEVASWAWHEVHRWTRLDQDTVGKQLIRAADSINANLVEGDGRHSDKEAIHHFYYARGSARETRLQIVRARDRKLVDLVEGNENIAKLTSATRLLNILLRYRKGSVSVVRESKTTDDPFTEEI